MPSFDQIYQFGFAAVISVILLYILRQDMKSNTESLNKLIESVGLMSQLQDKIIVRLLDDVLKRHGEGRGVSD